MISDDDEFLKMNQLQFKESWLSKYSSLLRSGIWHLTSISGILGINQSGYIEPNLGLRQYTFPQSENSYGKLQKSVCLFDFYTVNENEFIYTFDKWRCFFSHHKPFTIVLELNHEYLQPDIIQNRFAREDVGYKKMWIPYVEVWYPKEIPISAITRYFVIPTCEKYEFIELTKVELMKLAIASPKKAI